MPSRSPPQGSQACRPGAPPHNHPLFALPNVILTPHSAGLSKEAAIRMAISTARNVLAGIDGKLDPSMVINREVLRDAVSSRSRCQPETRALYEVAHQNFPLPAFVGQNGRRGRLLARSRLTMRGLPSCSSRPGDVGNRWPELTCI
jgi:hypothetical protein